MIIDFVAPENIVDLNKDEYKLAALVNWFELTWGSASVTKSEISKMLRSNGFSELKEIPMSDAVIAGTAKKTGHIVENCLAMPLQMFNDN